jgi:hypothetical protein
VTDEERKEAERFANAEADKAYELTPGFPSEKEWVSIRAYYATMNGYIAACETKRAEMMEAQGEWEYLDRKLIAERARSAKLQAELDDERKANYSDDFNFQHEKAKRLEQQLKAERTRSTNLEHAIRFALVYDPDVDHYKIKHTAYPKLTAALREHEASRD